MLQRTGIFASEDKICKIILFLNDIYTLLVHNILFESILVPK
jgi:hypothetical protein